MRISRLIDRLVELKEQFGDLEIQPLDKDLQLYDIDQITPVYTGSRTTKLPETLRDIYFVMEIDEAEKYI